MVKAYIAFGANLGNAAATLHAAYLKLKYTNGVSSVRMSSLYHSKPVQAHGPDFVNAVACLHTQLSPWQLLDKLQLLENLYGRQRLYRNAPRKLDLDLLLYGQVQCRSNRLILPHPRMHRRAFVLLPLCELAPNIVLRQGKLKHILNNLQNQIVKKIE